MPAIVCRCLDQCSGSINQLAGARNFLDKSNEQEHKRQGLDLNEMKLRLVVALERC